MNQSRYQRVEPVAGGSNNNGTIGEGAYGVVYKAIDRKHGNYVAMKKIRFDGVEDGVPPSALREITTLKHLQHPNVVVLQDVILETERLYLVFELIDMDLKKLMDSESEPLTPSLVSSYTRQILEGLAYCHSMGVMHRDLKPQNLLVSRDRCTLKLADFGLARTFTPAGRALTAEVITRWYRAPEILLGCNNYRCCVDVWSVGCIVAEMANKLAFLQGDSEIDQLHKIFRVLGTPTNNDWPGVQELPYWRNSFPDWRPRAWAQLVPAIGPDGWALMQAVMVYNPLDRISATEALRYPFVTRTYPSPDAQQSVGCSSLHNISPASITAAATATATALALVPVYSHVTGAGAGAGAGVGASASASAGAGFRGGDGDGDITLTLPADRSEEPGTGGGWEGEGGCATAAAVEVASAKRSGSRKGVAAQKRPAAEAAVDARPSEEEAGAAGGLRRSRRR